MNTLLKILFITLLLSGCALNPKPPCSLCISNAISFTLINPASQKKIDSATIIWQNTYFKNTDTIELYNSDFLIDTIYKIPGGASTYNVKISRAGYDSIVLNNIAIEESPEYRCGFANTKIFKIEMQKALLSKPATSMKTQYRIIEEYTHAQCY